MNNKYLSKLSMPRGRCPKDIDVGDVIEVNKVDRTVEKVEKTREAIHLSLSDEIEREPIEDPRDVDQIIEEETTEDDYQFDEKGYDISNLNPSGLPEDDLRDLLVIALILSVLVILILSLIIYLTI